MTNSEKEKAGEHASVSVRGVPSWRRQILIWIALGLVVFLCWFTIREIQIAKELAEVRSVVYEMDGRMGSLPFWPFGSEYFISFKDRTFTQGELSQLQGLKPLSERGTNYVIVHFKDTNLTSDDIHRLREICPRCRIYRIVNNEFLIDE